MKLLETAKANPGWTASVTLILGAAAFFTGMDKLVWYWQSHATAYAAQQDTQELQSNFDKYIAQQQEEAKLEKQRIELQAQYNQRLLELQQQQVQQVPNAPIGRPQDYQAEPFYREWDDREQSMWCCDSNDYEACYARQLWYRCS